MGHRRSNSHSDDLEQQGPDSSRTTRRALLAAPLIAAIGGAAVSPASATSAESKRIVTSINGKTGEILVTESTDAGTAAFIADPESLTRTALSEVITGLSDRGDQTGSPAEDADETEPLRADDWVGRIGARLAIPTPDPITNAGEAVHPSVLCFPEKWNGYRYWMGVTPYAGGHDKYEDPCILASHDGDKWVVPKGLTNPLDNAPGRPQYNSDPNLVFHDGKLHLFWRYLDKKATGREENIFLRTSTNGVEWTPKVKVYGSDKKVRRLVAPSFQFVDGDWHMWAVDIVPARKPLVHLTAASPTGDWSIPTVCSVPVKNRKTPWHVHIKRIGDQYVGLMNDTLVGGKGARKGDLYLITSNDGNTWKRSSKAIIPRKGPHHDNLYASTFICTPQGIDVWYSARLNGPPYVWSILRTRLMQRDGGTPYATAAGSVKLGTVPGNGGSAERHIAFPPGLFTKPPTVTATSDNGRVNPGTSGVSKAGCTLKGFNWTGVHAAAPTLHWTAIQMSD
ncbi:hypothetical protein ACFY5D_18355 [Paeniglutamicibacter sp. NPDC012692]|uniref:hypothetical protein n=1 Tax=Paeniglutamicibacter sp. NPDC012692 TaxID=3364388 RepID=UPI0036CEBFA4